MRTIHAAMLAGCLCCALMPAFAKDAGWQWYNEKLKPRDEDRKAAGGVAARRPSPDEKKPAEIARVDSNANPLTANNITITRRYFMMCITKTSPPVRGGC